MTTPALPLPATIPDLPQPCSPVRIADASPVPYHLRGKRGVILRIAPSDLGVPLAAVAVDGCEAVVLCGLDVLHLDLSDPTGRAHAAWCAGLLLTANTASTAEITFYREGNGWTMGLGRGRAVESWTDSDLDLDPNDPRTLPDGSRWVDAEALRRVVLSLAIERYPDHPAAAEWRAALDDGRRTEKDARTDPMVGDIVDGCEVVERDGDELFYRSANRAFRVSSSVESWRSWTGGVPVQRVAQPAALDGAP